MKKSHLRRSVVAVGVALATLMAVANPTSAGIHSAIITGGTLVSTKTGITETFNLAPAPPSCSAGTLSADLGASSATASSSLTVTGLGSSHVTAYSNGSSYLTVLSRSTTGNSAGHWTAGSSTMAPHIFESSRIAIILTIYNTTSCTPVGAPVCTVAAILHVNGYLPDSISTSNTFILTVVATVGTVVAAPTCSAGPSQILGTTIVNTTNVTGYFNVFTS